MYQVKGNDVIISAEEFLTMDVHVLEKIKNEIRFKGVESHENINKPVDLIKTISERLQRIGVKRHLMGYEYLRKAIYLCATDTKYINHLTSLYVKVAKEFKTMPNKVERAIRHAKELSGNEVTNGEFIADIVDDIRLELNMVIV